MYESVRREQVNIYMYVYILYTIGWLIISPDDYLTHIFSDCQNQFLIAYKMNTIKCALLYLW